jgi:phosphatidylcholine synthase
MNDQVLVIESRLATEELSSPEPARVPGSSKPLLRFRVMAWGVHLYTALGLMLAAAIAVLLVRGDASAFRWSFVLMLVATFIDATDGTLARAVGVKRVLPNFDGRKLDDLIDFLNYTFLPLLLVWRAGAMPGGHEVWLLFPLLASVYGFCQVQAKTDDGYFLGFPSHWNTVAFYLYVLPIPEWVALGSVIGFAVLTFVPTRYLYPTQPGLINVISLVLGAVWSVMIAGILWLMPDGRHPTTDPVVTRIAWISLFYPAFYLVVSWLISLRLWLRKPGAERDVEDA